MGELHERHSPLLAGIKVASSADVLPGTLTGLATRNADGKRVLVTCRHVMTAHDAINPTGDELMYHIDKNDAEHKVGKILNWVEVVDTPNPREGPRNTADLAIVELDPCVEASFAPHNGNHNMGIVRPGLGPFNRNTSLKVLGGESGEISAVVDDIDLTVPVLANSGGTRTWLRYEGVVRLRSTTKPFKKGDSGAPCLAPDPDNPGAYKMACIFFAALDDEDEDLDSSYLGLAIPTLVAQREMGITFGDLSQIYDTGRTFGDLSQITERGENMGTPAVTLQGFFGQRWIIDDYFRAGETLHCGDVVVVQERSAGSSVPRVFKATSAHKGRVIGVVHTPDNKVVGDVAAARGGEEDEDPGTADELVSIVVKGIAKTLSSGSIGFGDPLVASGSKGTPPGKTGEIVAMVAASSNHSHSPGVGGMTGDAGDHSHTVAAVSQGPAGPQGVQGTAGATGAQGLPGENGDPGQDGQDGQDGDPGPQVLRGRRVSRVRPPALTPTATPPTSTSTPTRAAAIPTLVSLGTTTDTPMSPATTTATPLTSTSTPTRAAATPTPALLAITTTTRDSRGLLVHRDCRVPRASVGHAAGLAFEGQRGRQGHGEQPAPEGQQGLRVETERTARTELMAMMDGMVLQDPGVRRGLEAGPASGGLREIRVTRGRRGRVGRGGRQDPAAAMTTKKGKTE